MSGNESEMTLAKEGFWEPRCPRELVRSSLRRLMPSGEKLGELVTGERLGGFEEFITETTFCKPGSKSRSAARGTSGNHRRIEVR